ncbi:MAG: hypothetical protein HY901_16045 [Deltaproteobacteria bacterium]|nr:hypothetical protein [Deltaproteobacteria bacterium]
MAARVANIVLGIWLFMSAFLWPHSPQQATNTWVMGVLCVSFAIVALAMPQASYLNTALSAWLLVSAFVLPRVSSATLWNNALVAVAIFLASLAPREIPRAMRRREAAP